MKGLLKRDHQLGLTTPRSLVAGVWRCPSRSRRARTGAPAMAQRCLSGAVNCLPDHGPIVRAVVPIAQSAEQRVRNAWLIVSSASVQTA